jgi:hypothetical protein
MNVKLQMSSKHLQIDKAQSTMLAATVIATIITIFSLVSAKSLLSQARFQNRVINARHAAAKQLDANVTAAKTLATQYNQVFIGTNPTNVIGGNSDNTEEVNGQAVATQPPNGDNGRIVLDALPNVYDYPALLTSLSKLLGQDGLGSPTIGGGDQSTSFDNQPSSNPQPTNIDLTVNGTAAYANIQNFIKDLERSTRPFDITKLSMTGSESSMTMTISATTYYQPAKTLKLTTKEIH